MPKPLSEADKLKNEKSLIFVVYTIDSQGRPSQNVTKIHQNPFSELSFFETKNLVGNTYIGFGIKNDLKNDTLKSDTSWLFETWGHPGDPLGASQGPRLQNWWFWRRFWSIFWSQSMKSEAKLSQNQRSERPRRPYPSYIVEFDELNRFRWVPKVNIPLKWVKIDEMNHEKLILLKIDAQSFPEADSELCYRAWRAESI